MSDDRLRASGRTTRIANRLIEDLFTKGFIRVEDHWDNPNAHRELFERTLERLSNEHPGIMSNLEIYKKELFIAIHNFES